MPMPAASAAPKSFSCSETRFARFLQKYDGQKKILSVLKEGILPLISELGRLFNASHETRSNIATAQNHIKVACDITGFFDIFRKDGMVPTVISTAKRMRHLFRTLYNDAEKVFLSSPKAHHLKNLVSVKVERATAEDNQTHETRKGTSERITLHASSTLKHNEIASGKTEKLLKLGEHACGMVGALTYAFSFGLSRPAANIRKYFNVHFTRAGHGLADAFAHVMFTNHLASFFQSIFELLYQNKAYDRGIAEGEYDNNEVYKNFMEKVVDSTMNIFEKLLELINDAFLFVEFASPPWLKIPVGLGISTIGCVRVWRKTA